MVAPAVMGSLVTGAFNSWQASKNRRFQREMSNTAWQRAMADMGKAGLNPILAAKVGPASTPGGSQAQMPDLGSSINTAQDISNRKEQIDQQINESKAKVNQIIENTKLTSAQIPQIEKQVELLGKQIEAAGIANQTAEMQLEFYKNNETLVNLHKQLGISMTTAGALSVAALGAALVHPASRALLIAGLKKKLAGNLKNPFYKGRLKQ